MSRMYLMIFVVMISGIGTLILMPYIRPRKDMDAREHIPKTQNPEIVTPREMRGGDPPETATAKEELEVPYRSRLVDHHDRMGKFEITPDKEESK